MKFLAPLTEGKILKRYKRFLADIQLSSGEIITAHTANTGSMKTCWEPGWKVLISFHDNPKRKLKYSLEMTHNGQTWIGINTPFPHSISLALALSGFSHKSFWFEGFLPAKKEFREKRWKELMKMKRHLF